MKKLPLYCLLATSVLPACIAPASHQAILEVDAQDAGVVWETCRDALSRTARANQPCTFDLEGLCSYRSEEELTRRALCLGGRLVRFDTIHRAPGCTSTPATVVGGCVDHGCTTTCPAAHVPPIDTSTVFDTDTEAGCRAILDLAPPSGSRCVGESFCQGMHSPEPRPPVGEDAGIPAEPPGPIQQSLLAYCVGGELAIVVDDEIPGTPFYYDE